MSGATNRYKKNTYRQASSWFWKLKRLALQQLKHNINQSTMECLHVVDGNRPQGNLKHFKKVKNFV